MLNLTLCHTAIVHVDEEGNKEYNAASQDELAFLYFAKNYGFVYEGKSNNVLTLQVSDQKHTFKILESVEFTSDR